MEAMQLLQLTAEELEKKITASIQPFIEELKGLIQPKQAVEYLTREETAEKLKINLSTLHNWVKKGILQSYAMGGRVYFKSGEIDKAMIKLN